MTTNWVRPTPGTTTGGAFLWDQFADAMDGKNDTDIVAYSQISAPGAPTAAIGSAGNLTGAYQYKVAFVTGYWPNDAHTGSPQTKGNTSGGTSSNTVNPSAAQVSLSGIPVGPTGVVQRILYRTKANGSTFYYLATLNDNTSITYIDNTADSSLGTQMPTSNTTGSGFVGDGSRLTNLPVQNPSDATTTAPGLVEVSDPPSGAHPVALTTDSNTYKVVRQDGRRLPSAILYWSNF